MSESLWVAIILTRILSLSIGTAGNRIALTNIPFDWRVLVSSRDPLLFGALIGSIGEVSLPPGKNRLSLVRVYRISSCRRFTRSLLFRNNSTAARAPPTTGGGSDAENMYAFTVAR